MSKPLNGTISLSDNDEWYFYPGKSKEGILRPDLVANCQTWMDTRQFLKGLAKL